MGCLLTAIYSEAADPIQHAPDGKTKVAETRLSSLPAAEVAKEIVKLQEQMGGSVVRDRPGLQGWNAPTVPITPEGPSAPQLRLRVQPNFASAVLNKVTALREAARELDAAAHRLEKHDLYTQADAMRELAGRFLSEARTLKKATKNR